MIVETHENRSSPLGPAEQLHGGSSDISASSFCAFDGRMSGEHFTQQHASASPQSYRTWMRFAAEPLFIVAFCCVVNLNRLPTQCEKVT